VTPLMGGLFATLCVLICGSGRAQVKTDGPAPSVAAASVTAAQILAAQKRADELIAQMSSIAYRNATRGNSGSGR
jgi:hypothetical protein